MRPNLMKFDIGGDDDGIDGYQFGSFFTNKDFSYRNFLEKSHGIVSEEETVWSCVRCILTEERGNN